MEGETRPTLCSFPRMWHWRSERQWWAVDHMEIKALGWRHCFKVATCSVYETRKERGRVGGNRRGREVAETDKKKSSVAETQGPEWVLKSHNWILDPVMLMGWGPGTNLNALPAPEFAALISSPFVLAPPGGFLSFASKCFPRNMIWKRSEKQRMQMLSPHPLCSALFFWPLGS